MLSRAEMQTDKIGILNLIDWEDESTQCGVQNGETSTKYHIFNALTLFSWIGEAKCSLPSYSP
jgi:hypothetical protein